MREPFTVTVTYNEPKHYALAVAIRDAIEFALAFTGAITLAFTDDESQSRTISVSITDPEPVTKPKPSMGANLDSELDTL